jgi:hypothetical protein
MNRVARLADRRTFIAWANDYQRVTTEDESMPHQYALTVEAWDPSHLGQTVREACIEVRARIESKAFERGGATFADFCARGLLTPSYNFLSVAPRKNECGWVPVDLPDVPLAERVLALFAVDYLWAPKPYRESLSVCRACGAVAFAEEVRAGRRSGIWPSPRAGGAGAHREGQRCCRGPQLRAARNRDASRAGEVAYSREQID